MKPLFRSQFVINNSTLVTAPDKSYPGSKASNTRGEKNAATQFQNV